ncbi:hypothetical protein [Deinococcus ficus]|nr:hypothetical protein [Deinococcus ficus]
MNISRAVPLTALLLGGSLAATLEQRHTHVTQVMRAMKMTPVTCPVSTLKNLNFDILCSKSDLSPQEFQQAWMGAVSSSKAVSLPARTRSPWDHSSGLTSATLELSDGDFYLISYFASTGEVTVSWMKKTNGSRKLDPNRTLASAPAGKPAATFNASTLMKIPGATLASLLNAKAPRTRTGPLTAQFVTVTSRGLKGPVQVQKTRMMDVTEAGGKRIETLSGSAVTTFDREGRAVAYVRSDEAGKPISETRYRFQDGRLVERTDKFGGKTTKISFAYVNGVLTAGTTTNSQNQLVEATRYEAFPNGFAATTTTGGAVVKKEYFLQDSEGRMIRSEQTTPKEWSIKTWTYAGAVLRGRTTADPVYVTKTTITPTEERYESTFLSDTSVYVTKKEQPDRYGNPTVLRMFQEARGALKSNLKEVSVAYETLEYFN